ncbi:MAG: 4-cresol dehydrogenase (hydroxylating) [Paraglaciecola sp.]|jgi:4-cresol dehydrogenase (hydroxylating)
MDFLSILQRKIDKQQATIVDKQGATKRYGNSTFSKQVQIDAAIVVLHEDAIKIILTLANELMFHLYPISSGQNWGYGSVQNTLLNHPKVVLDLSQLKKITPTSQELGLITIQPGVTQQDLYDYLQINHWPFMVPVTGAGPSCSILSNALERGYGITPRTDHFAAVNALKAYLPHPDFCQTLYQSAVSGLDGSGNDFIDKTFKWGLGPYIDGLFTQSNFAIVTEITIRLAPFPKYFSAFYLQVFDDKKFHDVVKLIRNLLMDCEGIVGSINLMDRSRLISMVADNPNGNAKHQNMTSEQISHIAKQKRIPQWLVVGSMYGTKSVVKATKRELYQRGKKLGTINFSNSWLMNSVKFMAKLPLPKLAVLNNIKEQLHSLNEGIEIMLGKPNQVALPLAYWRNPHIRPDKTTALLPDKDKCGLLWYAPLIQMDPEVLAEFVDFIRRTTPKYGIEPLITFTNLRHDCIDSTVPLVFDLTNEAAVKLAHQCLEELFTEGCKQGFVPYRINTQQQSQLNKNDIFWQTTCLLKNALDPNNIISPARYNP